MNILLFPGSFSPYTDGHYGIVSRYINAAKKQNTPIDKVVIFMSSKPRENIKPMTVYKFVSRLYSNDKRFEILYSSDKGPVSDVYSYVNKENSKGNKNNYIFLRSSKDDDKLAQDFYTSFSKGGKYALPNVTVTKLDVDDSPLLYKNRKDQYANKPISASVVREDLRNNDFDKFLTSFYMMGRSEMTINRDVMKKYFDVLVKEVGKQTKESKRKLLKESFDLNVSLPSKKVFDLNKIPKDVLVKQYRNYLHNLPLDEFGSPFLTDKKGDYVLESWNEVLPPDEIVRNIKKRWNLDDSQFVKKEAFHKISIYILIADIGHNIEIITKDMDQLGYFKGREKDLGYEYGNSVWKQIQFEPKEQMEIPLNELEKLQPLFHWTPYYCIQSIIKEGLKPKNENSYFNYPPRIYFFAGLKNDNEVLNWGNKLNKFNENPKNDGKYILLKLKRIPNIHFYFDPNLENAVFTKDAIDSENLQFVTNKQF